MKLKGRRQSSNVHDETKDRKGVSLRSGRKSGLTQFEGKSIKTKKRVQDIGVLGNTKDRLLAMAKSYAKTHPENLNSSNMSKELDRQIAKNMTEKGMRLKNLKDSASSKKIIFKYSKKKYK